MSPLPLTYKPQASVLIMGVGLMGQHMACNVLNWLDVKKLVIADHTETIMVGTEPTRISDFAASIAAQHDGTAEVIAETVDVTSEEQVKDLLERHGKIDYFMHTAGIAPSPLTPPEQLTKDAIMRAYEVNLWGVHNVLKQGVKGGSLRGARGVIVSLDPNSFIELIAAGAPSFAQGTRVVGGPVKIGFRRCASGGACGQRVAEFIRRRARGDGQFPRLHIVPGRRVTCGGDVVGDDAI